MEEKPPNCEGSHSCDQQRPREECRLILHEAPRKVLIDVAVSSHSKESLSEEVLEVEASL